MKKIIHIICFLKRQCVTSSNNWIFQYGIYLFYYFYFCLTLVGPMSNYEDIIFKFSWINMEKPENVSA